MRSTIIIVLSLFILVFTNISANPSKLSQYEGEVSVANRNQSSFKTALPKALAQVLVKVSGNPNVLDLAAIKTSLNSAEDKVRSYSYHNESFGVGGESLYLKVRFDDNAIQRILKSAKQVVWEQEQPEMMIWLVVDDPTGRYILTEEGDQAILDALRGHAERRGLQLYLPVLDLQDQDAVTTAQVWTLDPEIRLASEERYGISDVIVGRVIPQFDGSWSATWMVSRKGREQSFNNQGDSASLLFSAMIDRLANQMAQQYRVDSDPTALRNITVSVQGVDGLDSFAEIVTYLRALPPVRKVEVKNVAANHILLAVDVVGGENVLTDIVAQQQRLSPISDYSADTYRQPDVLQFRWMDTGLPDSVIP